MVLLLLLLMSIAIAPCCRGLSIDAFALQSTFTCSPFTFDVDGANDDDDDDAVAALTAETVDIASCYCMRCVERLCNNPESI